MQIGDKVLYKSKEYNELEVDPYKNGVVLEINGKREWILNDDLKEITTPQWTDFSTIGQAIGQLVDEKNKQYGDSFNKCGDFLKILYPNGVKPEQYTDMLGVTRIFDKLMRIANGNQGEENAWQDIVGYGILKVKG